MKRSIKRNKLPNAPLPVLDNLVSELQKTNADIINLLKNLGRQKLSEDELKDINTIMTNNFQLSERCLKGLGE